MFSTNGWLNMDETTQPAVRWLNRDTLTIELLNVENLQKEYSLHSKVQ
jgi:hypothetical protein